MSSGWSIEGYVLIAREDIISTLGPQNEESGLPFKPSFTRVNPVEDLLDRDPWNALVDRSLFPTESNPLIAEVDVSRGETEEKLGDGFDDVIAAIDNRRFTKDDRIHRVPPLFCELLCIDMTGAVTRGLEHGVASRHWNQGRGRKRASNEREISSKAHVYGRSNVGNADRCSHSLFVGKGTIRSMFVQGEVPLPCTPFTHLQTSKTSLHPFRF